ncbi:uncharacterized protein LOC142463429 [Ascaphus truei]|uniref:uncharacterized protein LOC142463429 n=1 Tax=Ascaphus truei TaxID=8439 RepID=UPI003F597718
MLHLFKKKHVLPKGAQTALDLVRTREGKKYTKHATNLYKLAGVPPTGRLQPSIWSKMISESRGMLEDKGLLEVAQAHLRVAGKLCDEGYEEVRGEGGAENTDPLYGYMKPVKTEETHYPPPYQDGARPSSKGWVCHHCGMQNPAWRDFCYNCGVPRPSPPPISSEKPAPSAPAQTPPPAPLYPILTPSGSFYQGPDTGKGPSDTQGPKPAGTQGPTVSETHDAMSALQVLFPIFPFTSLQEFLSTPEALAASQQRRQAIRPDSRSESETSDLMEFDHLYPPQPHPQTPYPRTNPHTYTNPPPTSTPRAPPLIINPTPVVPTRPPQSLPLSDTLPRAPEQWLPALSKPFVTRQGKQVIVTVGTGDITTAVVDVIVNPANSQLQHGGGLARSISLAAGPSMQRDCNLIISRTGQVPSGQIAVTGPGNLPIALIIHAVGPQYDPNLAEVCESQLKSVVWNTLIHLSDQACAERGISSVAFPLISTGLFRYPLEPAVKVIVDTIREFIATHSTQLTEIRIVTDKPERMPTLRSALLSKGPLTDDIVPSAVPPLPGSQVYHSQGKLVIKPEPAAEGQHTAMTDNTPRNVTKLGLQYVTFTPTQVSTLVSGLPDPEKQPMPFYRRMCQIQKTYGCTWQDLQSLTEIKCTDSFLPLMASAFDQSQSQPIDTYSSGLTYCQQLKLWAQEALTELQGSLQEITQQTDESVEQYGSRIRILFEDLGFATQAKAHRMILTKAFIDGLHEQLKDKIMSIRPDCIGGTLQDAILVAKGFARSQAKELKDKGKKKALALMMQENECTDAVLCPSLTASPPAPASFPPQSAPAPFQTPSYNPYPPPPFPPYPQPYPAPAPAPAYAPFYPQPIPQQGCYPYNGPQQDRRQNGGGRSQGRPTCWNCGIVGHIRRDCRKPRPDQLPEGPPPRS